jgi:hypothetical protein
LFATSPAKTQHRNRCACIWEDLDLPKHAWTAVCLLLHGFDHMNLSDSAILLSITHYLSWREPHILVQLKGLLQFPWTKLVIKYRKEYFPSAWRERGRMWN